MEFGEAHIILLGEEFEEVLEFIAEGGSSQIISIILATMPLAAFAYSMVTGSFPKTDSAR